MPKSENVSESDEDFLANTLHEIRTPLQTIIGTLELLTGTPLNDEQTEYVRQIKFSSDVLLTLANDVLDFSKIRSREFKLENIPFDITFLTEQVGDLVTIEAFNKGVEIIIDIDHSVPPLVMGDPTRIQQILLNLIKNAVKFTPKGYIQITLTVRNTELFYQVADNGIGITAEKRAKLFTNFYQTDKSTTRKYGGTGLGLSICKNLVEAMHGSIGAKANQPCGSIFWFTVPYVPGTRNMVPIPPTPVQIPAHTRILLVDDQILALKSLSNKLQAFGIHDIQTTDSGEQALQCLEDAAKQKHPFTEVFIDMVMPIMDGWRLAADINANTAINNAKLYLLVPEGQMGGEAKMKLLNWFNGYLYKPIKRNKLREVLTKAFTEPMDLEIVEDEQKLPAVMVQQQTAREQEDQIAKGMHILIAEDHPVNRKLLATFLEKMGTKPLEAADGTEAVRIAKQHPETELIFMDIQMPGIDGIKAATELRQQGFSGIIIACTANNNEPDLKSYYEKGINDILLKPFRSSSVKVLLEKWKNALHLPVEQKIAEGNYTNEDRSVFWSTKEFEKIINGDKTFGQQLLNDFLSQTSGLLDTAENAYNGRDWNTIRQIGHTLQGSSATISARALAGYAAEMTVAAKSENADMVKTCLGLLKESLQKFTQAANEWKKKHE